MLYLQFPLNDPCFYKTSVVKKVAGYCVDVLEERHDKVMENLQVHKSEFA